MGTVAFDVPVEGGSLTGWRTDGPTGVDALLLHGGPGLSDYLEELAAELDGVARPIRYQQRGTPPSTAPAGGGVDAHVADALAVLDACGLERTWIVGHSWGGHLAMHLAVVAPDRVQGIVVVDPLGAVPDGGHAELGESLTARLSPTTRAAVDELDARLTAGEGSEEEGLEMLRLVWPYYFADPDSAPPMPPMRMSNAAYADTWASIVAHFDRDTLVGGLPGVGCPAVFVAGRESPIPWRRSAESAALIPGARLDVVDGCGHFPWLERPGSVRAALLALVD